MNKRKKALVLGGTVPHCELIRQLKERGYYTVLVDYLDNPPAKAVADEHVQESTMDKEKVLEIAREKTADLVICGCVDQANITACYVSEKLGLTRPYSYETASQITNKGVMKRVMMEKGIPTSKYIFFDRADQEVKATLRYPVMVKPADSNSSNGVKKALNESEMKMYLRDAIQISRSGKAIVEEFVQGREISAYCFIKERKAKLLMTAERISTTDGAAKAIKCYASIAPARLSQSLTIKAEYIATQIAEAFNLNNTPLFFQAMVENDDILVIEFAPRTGGGMCFYTIKFNTGFDIISATIDSWLGIDADLSSWHAPENLVLVNTVYGKDGIFDHIEGINELLNGNVVEAAFPIKMGGDVLDISRAASSRVIFLIVKADDEKNLLSKVEKIYETIKVLDPCGENLLREDLNIKVKWNEIKKLE